MHASGTNFTLRNLDRSPLDWAEAGLGHYRENPIINASTRMELVNQQTLDEWTDHLPGNIDQIDTF